MSSAATKPAKSCRLGAPNARSRTGTDRTEGQPTFRTTCSLGSLASGRADAARLWVKDAAGKALSKEAFINLAVDELTKRTLAENPDFKLPPEFAF